jgi:hypothetical protein
MKSGTGEPFLVARARLHLFFRHINLVELLFRQWRKPLEKSHIHSKAEISHPFASLGVRNDIDCT